jgi:hypothetical protein
VPLVLETRQIMTGHAIRNAAPHAEIQARAKRVQSTQDIDDKLY